VRHLDARTINVASSSMKRLVLVEPDEGARSDLAAHLREDGDEVIEVDERHALSLCRERIDAVFVWTTREAGRAAEVLRQIDGSGRPRILFYAPNPSRDALPTSGAAPVVLVGETPAMRDLRATLRRLGSRPRTHVLVGGEAGSGKQTVARALHHATSVADEFVHLTPARLRELMAAGLPSFDGGVTLYLPSIEDVEQPRQQWLADLLAVHERFDAPPVRLVIGLLRSAQQLSLGRLVERALHPALAARVPVLLDLLPLRKRMSDVPPLVSHLLAARSASSGLPCPDVSPAALDTLNAYAWPGNVRELANVLERASVSGKPRIDVGELPALECARAGVDYELPSGGIDFVEFERSILVQALAHARGNQTQAAALLGLTRDQIRYRMSKFKIER
jgi:DNA-binding NtrC family response regulator